MKSYDLIVGASGAVGKALGKLLAKSGQSLILTSTDERTASACANDLKNRFDIDALGIKIDFTDSQSIIEALKNLNEFKISNLFHCSGQISESDLDISEVECVQKLTQINYLGPVIFTNSLLESKEIRNVSVCSSIAVTIPRNINKIYASAKSALETYFLGLSDFCSDRCQIQIFRLGYIHSRMTEGKKLPLPPTTPENVAQYIFDHLGKPSGIYTYPKYWRPLLWPGQLMSQPLRNRFTRRLNS